MANSTIQVNLAFKADTSAAKQQIADLQQSLSNLAGKTSISPLGLTPELQKATNSALNLKAALDKATDVNTGKLNLNNFLSQIEKGKMSISDYGKELAKLGPEGVKAFNQVTQAIVNSDKTTKKLSAGMEKLKTTFENTVRWSITATVVQKITDTLRDTVQYAEKLDKSLNNIQIVTGKGAREMARFAKEANAMAKTLSTTTTKFSDASLIYYQQGLDNKEVMERTEATVKLANVVGKTASEVSEWMTAIWNNFDDGSKSLEYYADVLTKLGAATASSADEIAGGLEKFASIADTVGLSYEYAASALATITAETRQSEEVVGTALKTIFSRMENLELGKTLDDGTTLGKYAEALQVVGVNIKDANGELKDMDVILQQTGQVWQGLSRDGQVALAQQVAGIRQYSQFMALMDNWNVMEENIKMSKEATGELEHQQAIYEQSVEAAKDRAEAAKEGLMTEILNGDNLKSFYKILEQVFTMAESLVEAFGGLPGILMIAGTYLTRMYSDKIAEKAQNMAASFGRIMNGDFSGKNARKEALEKEAVETSIAISGDSSDAEIQVLKHKSEMSSFLLKNGHLLSDVDKERINLQMQLLEKQAEEIKKSEEDLKAKELKTQELEEQLRLTSEIEGLTKAEQEAGDEALSHMFNVADNKGNANSMLKSAKQISNQVEFLNLDNLSEENRASFREDLASKGAAIEKEAQNILSNSSLTKDQQAAKMVEIQKINEDFQNPDIKMSEAQYAQALEAFTQAVFDEINKELQEAILEANEKINPETSNTAKELGKELENETNKMHSIEEKQNTTKLQLKAADEEVKTAQSNYDQVLDEATTPGAKKGLIRKAKKAQEELDKKKGEKDNLEQNLKKQNEEYEKQQKTVKSLVKQKEKAAKQDKKNIKNLENVAKAHEEDAENTADLKKNQDKLNDSMDNMNKGSKDAKSYSNALGSIIGAASSAVTGITMLSSGMSALTDCIKDGNASWQDYLSAIVSVGSGIAQTIGSMVQFSEILTKNTEAAQGDIDAKKRQTDASKEKELQDASEHAEDMKGPAIDSANVVSDTMRTQAEEKNQKKRAKFNLKEKMSNIGTAISGIVKQLGSGPAGWATAIISIAAIASIAGPILGSLGIGGGMSEEEKEENSETVQKSTENVKTINKNQEMSKSVDDLTDKYQALKAAGESTKDTFSKLQEQMPALIQSYEDLENQLNMDIDTTGLERAMEIFERTGDLTLWEQEKEKVDEQVKQAEKDEIEKGLEAGNANLKDSLTTGQGGMSGTNYGRNIGGHGNESKESSILADTLGEDFISYSDDNDVTVDFDTSDPTKIATYYNKLLEAKKKMDNELTDEQKKDSGIYTEVEEEIAKLAEDHEAIQELYSQAQELATEEFTDGEDKDIFKSVFGDTETVSLEKYQEERKTLIDKIKETYPELDNAAAEAMLKQSEVFKGLEDGFKLFGEEGSITEQINQNGQIALSAVQSWYESLSEDDKTLAIGLDYTNITSEEQLQEELDKMKEKEALLKIDTAAEQAGFDLDHLNTYAEMLADNNTALGENKALAKQVALNNMQLNKGLGSLQDSWEDNVKILKANNKLTPEYAEALNSVKQSLKEAFGVDISAKAIEENLGIIQKVAQGDTKALEELHDVMASDYIENMEIGVSLDSSVWGHTVDQTRKYLQDIMDEIDRVDTSISFGEGSEINASYMENLQKMLDSGSITTEQMQEMFRAKGYELEITGWKDVPGPKKTFTQTIIDGEGKGTSKTWEENETIKVPIINGDYSSVKTGPNAGKTDGPKATITKSYNEKTIDYSKTEAGKNDDKEKKDLDEEIERYHKVDKQLEDLERQYNKIDKAKEKAFGVNKIALFNQQVDNLTKKAETLRTKLTEAEGNYKKDSGEILGWGAKLDQEGNITNYEELITKYVKKVNNGSMTEDQYTKFQDDLSRYEETLTIWKDTKDEIEDTLDQIRETKLATIEYEVEYKIEASEYGLEYVDYMLEKVEDDAYKAAEAIDLMTQSTQEYLKQADSYKKGISDIISLAGGSDKDINSFINGDIFSIEGLDLQSGDIDLLKDYASSLLEINSSLMENHNSTLEKLTEAFENIGEEFDNVREKMDALLATYDNIRNVADLVGNKVLGADAEFYKTLNESTVKAKQEILQNSINERAVTESALNQLRQDLASATSKEEINYYEDMIDEAEKKLYELDQTIADDLSSALEAVNQQFEDSMMSSMEALDEALGGVAGSFEKLTQQFDRQKEISNLYLQDYQKMYETSKMIRDIEKKKDSTENIKAQRELAALQEEVAKFQEDGAKMSQYDAEYLQKKYDLTLAQIALEEAQNAKSQVTLRQDTSGNYGYVYTADQDNIAKAEQSMEDAQYRYSDWAYNTEVELTEQRNAALRSMMEELQELRVQDYASEEEYYAARQEIIDHYTQITDFCYDTLEDLVENNWLINEQFNTDMADSYEETLLGRMYPDTQNFQGLQKKEFDTLNQYTVDNTIAYDTWRQGVQGSLGQVGTSAETFKYDMINEEDGYLTLVDKKINQLGEDSQALVGKTDQAFKDVAKKVKNHWDEYNTNIQKYIKSNEDLYNNLGKLISQYSRLITKQQQAANPPEIPSPGAATNQITGTGGLSNDNSGKETFAKGTVFGEGGRGNVLYKGYNKKTKSLNKIGDYHLVTDSNGQNWWAKSKDIESFTGTDSVGGKVTQYRLKNDNAELIREDQFNKTWAYYKGERKVYELVDGSVKEVRYVQLDDGYWYPNFAKSGGYVTGAGKIDGKQVYEFVGTEKGMGLNKAPNWIDKDIIVYVQNKGKVYNTAGYDGNNVRWGSLEPGMKTYTKTSGNGRNQKPTTYYYGSKIQNFAIIGNRVMAQLSDNGHGEQQWFPLSWLGYTSQGQTSLKSGTAVTPFNEKNSLGTGGYTGSWGPEGRIAMLHQKEIVLNAHDTENFLTAIDIVRTLQDNLLSSQMRGLISNFTNSVSSSIQGINNTNETKQDVYINAEFPNASKADEIEEALRGLMNDASQYITRY